MGLEFSTNQCYMGCEQRECALAMSTKAAVPVCILAVALHKSRRDAFVESVCGPCVITREYSFIPIQLLTKMSGGL